MLSKFYFQTFEFSQIYAQLFWIRNFWRNYVYAEGSLWIFGNEIVEGNVIVWGDENV
jgi:hypothetical protein